MEGNIIDAQQFESELNNIYGIETTKSVYLKNTIHPTAVIGHHVQMGEGNYIGANCYIVGETVIGNNNHFEAFCSVGTFPEHKAYFDNKEIKGVVIGDNNVFREFITINAGCTSSTTIGNKVWMLKGSHVGHDSTIEDDVTLSCNAIVGGYSTVMQGANFGLGAICHQKTLIGAYAMLGMGCIITKKSAIHAFSVYIGNPAKWLRPNTMKLKHFSNEQIDIISSEYEKLIKINEQL